MNYIHSTPGRLRVRSARLRGSPGEGAQLRAHLLALAGVHAVEVNDLLGSILIRYDCALVSVADVWSALFRLGHVLDQRPPLSGDAESPLTVLTSTVSRRLVEMLAEKIAEASVVAVLSAVI